MGNKRQPGSKKRFVRTVHPKVIARIKAEKEKIEKERLASDIREKVTSDFPAADVTASNETQSQNESQNESQSEINFAGKKYPSGTAYVSSPHPKKKTSEKVRIDCLRCQKKFLSRCKKGNRICEVCKRLNENVRGPEEYRVVVEHRTPGGLY